MKNGEMHAVAGFGAVLLSAALIAPTVFFARESGAGGPPLQNMTVIEASLAYRPPNAPKSKQPQKVKQAPAPEVKPDGVSRDENKKVDETKPKKDDKPVKETDPLAQFHRPLPDDTETGTPTAIPAFDGSQFGIGDVTKGDPYFQRLVADLAWSAPELAKSGATWPVGCVQLTADGKIPETKFKTQGDGDLQPLAEVQLRELKDKRTKTPEQVPTHLLRALTTKWVCFEFKVKG